MERNSSSSPKSATKACATPVPAGKAATSPASTATRSSPRRSVPRPRTTTKISSSAMWACHGKDCLTGRITSRLRPTLTDPAALPRSCSRRPNLPSSHVSSGTSRIFTTPSRWFIRALSSRVVDLRGEPGMGSYTRRTHTMGLPKAIQKEAWSDRTYRNRAGAWCPDRRGNLQCPCRLEHRTAYQRSWPPRAEVRNALGTRGSARGGELPHRGRPALGRLVASFSAGKEDGNCPPRPQGSKASLRGDSSGSLEERSKHTPLRPPRAGLLRGKIHLPGSLRVDRYFCGHKVRDLQSRRSANRPHRLLDGRRGRPDQRIQGRACRGGGGRLTLCLRAGVGAGPTEEANMSSV